MAVVSVKDVADAIDMCPQEAQAYLNIKSGEMWTSPGGYDDDDNEEDEAKAGEIENSADWVSLPPKADWHEYQVMVDFCEELEEGPIQTQLLQALDGRRAFRRFKDALDSKSLRDQWFAYRDARLLEFVAEWLKDEGIPFEP